jgi:MFS family permease
MLVHPLFSASIAWNFGHGMSWLAVPLYANVQGLSNAEIGAIISLPVIAQAPLNLVGGAFADRLGGRVIMLLSASALAAATLQLSIADGFWMLLISQVMLVFSRAIFWPATWAMASELPGARGVQLGRLNAAINLGQISGSVACGALLAAFGFQAAFAALLAAAAVAFAAALRTASLKRDVARQPLFAAYLPLLRKRIIRYSMFCAYVSGIPFALSLSFYPLLFLHYGYGNDASGVFLALRSVGAFAAALVAGHFVRSGPGTRWPIVCGLVIAASVGGLPLTSHAGAIALWMLLVGVGAGAIMLYYQVTISEASTPDQRSSALALGGVGWNLSMLTIPLLMGVLADRYGIVLSFYVVGALTLACALILAVLRRWAA